jgi:hypothetical protein
MHRLWTAAILAALGFPAHGADGLELSMKSRASASESALAVAPSSPKAAVLAPAPFSARDPLPEILLRDEQERRAYTSSCEKTTRDFCYDLADGRVSFRGARRYMPQVEGLRAESVSLRQNRLVFKYSFR